MQFFACCTSFITHRRILELVPLPHRTFEDLFNGIIYQRCQTNSVTFQKWLIIFLVVGVSSIVFSIRFEWGKSIRNLSFNQNQHQFSNAKWKHFFSLSHFTYIISREIKKNYNREMLWIKKKQWHDSHFAKIFGAEKYSMREQKKKWNEVPT